MTQEEIIKALIVLLDGHLTGLRGSMQQEPYKGDFFELFAQARRIGYFEPPSSPLLTADLQRDILVYRWFADDGQDDKRQELLDQLLSAWREWRYALEHYGLAH